MRRRSRSLAGGVGNEKAHRDNFLHLEGIQR